MQWEDQENGVFWKSIRKSISRESKSFKQLCQMLLKGLEDDYWALEGAANFDKSSGVVEKKARLM